MADDTPTGQEHDTDQAATTTVSVIEAAAFLGITPDAVRARIRRGSLEAEKRDGSWFVTVPGDTQQDADATATGPDTTASPALVAQLQSEVEYLRDQLDKAHRTAEKERERADVLQREALDRLQGLIPIALGPPGSPESVEAVSHGSTVGQGDTTATDEQRDATGGMFSWLRRLFTG